VKFSSSEYSTDTKVSRLRARASIRYATAG
jgi:hypothetical protein